MKKVAKAAVHLVIPPRIVVRPISFPFEAAPGIPDSHELAAIVESNGTGERVGMARHQTSRVSWPCALTELIFAWRRAAHCEVPPVPTHDALEELTTVNRCLHLPSKHRPTTPKDDHRSTPNHGKEQSFAFAEKNTKAGRGRACATPIHKQAQT